MAGGRWPRRISGEDPVSVAAVSALGSGVLGRHTLVPRGGLRTLPELSGMLCHPGRLQGNRRDPSAGRAGRTEGKRQVCVRASAWIQPSLRLSRTCPGRQPLMESRLRPGFGCLRLRESNLENKVIPF